MVKSRPSQENRLAAKELHLQFEYDLPKRVVYGWWTGISGTGYVGKAQVNQAHLKGWEKILVETKWKITGMTMTLMERLTLHSEDRWTWQPRLLGISKTDEFRLAGNANSKTGLTIDSTILSQGAKGRLVQFLLGRRLDRMMR